MGGIADALSCHRRIGIDTSPFIYHLEGSSRYSSATAELFRRIEQGDIEGVTSVLTLMELAVRPLRMGMQDVADECEVLLASFPNLTIVRIDRPVARRAAELRAACRLRPADALQVASCIEAGATAFVTNDRELRRVSEIAVLILDDFVHARE